MNGFGDHGEDAFGPAKEGIVSSFDAFPKTKKTYLVQGRNSSAWTVTLILTCLYLSWSEIQRWRVGTTSQAFSVETGVSHDMQINLDVIVKMRCDDVHVNMQDAAGDRTLAGDLLSKDATSWSQWTGYNLEQGTHELGKATQDSAPGWEEEWDVHDQLGKARRRKFQKTPRLRGAPDSCRVFGSLQGNKVQGDFHITARGHGYQEFGDHLDHTNFNFSHIIRELSFGPYYPSLQNPLDNTIATVDAQDYFYKFQYYLSIVPTIYTDDPALIPYLDTANLHTKPLPYSTLFHTAHAVYTNQYAVTSQSHKIPDSYVPGIFFKFDIEPIMLSVMEEWGGFWRLLVRLVNVISGVMVAGSWAWQMTDWGIEVVGRKGRKNRGADLGVLGTPAAEKASWD